jgi:type VI secretion system protein ImpJ
MDRPIPDLIQWHEGLLLTPQHFQQLSSRVESLIQALPAWYVPFHWGVRSFEYDSTDFTAGVLTVRTLDAVMPDGLHVSVAGRKDELQLDMRPLAGTLRHGPTLVHLAIPLANGHAQATMDRFTSYESDPIVDENTGEGGVAIPRLKPQLSLIAAAQPPARFTSFPLLEVRCEGETFLATPFTPPTLHVTLSSPLGRKCAELSERLRMKAMELAERAILAPQSPFAAEARSQLQALVSALPAFEAVLRTEAAHPCALYVEACRLAGEVAVLGRGLLPPVFSPYVHNDPRRSFEQVMQFITQAVDEGLPDTVRRFAFEQDGDGFRLVADPAWTGAFALGSLARLVLAVRCEDESDRVMTWGENCVIGGQTVIASVLARRVLGLRRRYAEHIGELRPPRGIHLFELVPDAEVLPAGEDLVVLGSSAGVRPEALYLYVYDPDVQRTF